MVTLNCKGKIVSLDKPLVMGIINATPDSFYSTGSANGIEKQLELAAHMVRAGADIIDVGGQSTRPGSTRIGTEEEAARVVPLVKAITGKFPGTVVSIDTYAAAVAIAAVDAGASMVNDISGGTMDAAMLATVAALRVPYICTHMQGRPETMQENPHYDDVVTEVLDYFTERIAACTKAGIKDMIIDPGFGFGKTTEHNFQLLHGMELLKITGKPVLAGVSRKGMIYRTLHTTAAEALNGTTVLHTLALQNGAMILRAHDVREAKEAVVLMEAYKKAAPERSSF